LDQLFQEVKEAKKRSKLKTIPSKKLENIIGIMSIGGDALKDADRYYE